MSSILLIDDDAAVRNALTAVLRTNGHQAACTGDSLTAAQFCHQTCPDIVFLDVSMPGKDGLSVLREIRDDPKIAHLPVILLTARRDKELILKAAKLGVQGFILKTSLSVKDLLSRIDQLKPRPSAPVASTPVTEKIESSASPLPVAPSPSPDPIKLTREQTLHRAQKALLGCALPGVVTQVISAASSPDSSINEIAHIIAHDPVLSARVLHAANSPAFTTSGKNISSIQDAVRQIGCARIRDLAAATGIFDLFPLNDHSFENPLRRWQHSLAVAEICQHLASFADPALTGVAYLVGLCHDLGEIILSACFHDELAHIRRVQTENQRPHVDVELEFLGITHGELVNILLKQLNLPPAIRDPITAFHHAHAAGAELPTLLSRLLRLADVYANGLLLASHAGATLFPITATEILRSFTHDPLPPADTLIAQTAMLTCTLANIPANQIARALPPLFPRRDIPICALLHPSFSSWNPIATALSSLSTNVSFPTALPAPAALVNTSQLVIIAPSTTFPSFDIHSLAASLKSLPSPPQILWLASKIEGIPSSNHTPLIPLPISLPISLQDLATQLSIPTT